MSPQWIPGISPAPMLVIDYAWWRPDPAKVLAAGYKGVIRYVSHDITKSLSAGELQEDRAAGLAVGVIFEDEATRALAGAAAGAADAAFANAYLDKIGWPDWKPVGYAIDFAVTPEQMPTVLAYIEAANRGKRRAFGYGSSSVVDALVAAGIPDDWQTCAWSHGLVNDKAAIYQRLRPTTGLQGSFDEDVILHPSNDLWFPGETEPAKPAPTPIPPAPALKVAVTKDGDFKMTLLERHSSGAWYTVAPTLAYKHHIVSPVALGEMQKRPDIYTTLGLDDADLEAIADA